MAYKFEKKTVRVPLVHLNGTSKRELQDQAEAAYLALGAARKALTNMAPNARDYYPIREDRAFEKAMEQNHAWQNQVLDLQRQLVAFAEGLETGKLSAETEEHLF